MPKKQKKPQDPMSEERRTNEEQGLLEAVEGLLGPINAEPGDLLGNKKATAPLRAILSSLYSAGKIGNEAGLPRIYASDAFAVDQIIPQVDPLTDAVVAATEKYLQTREAEQGQEEETEEQEEDLVDVDEESAEDDDDDEDEKYREFAELMAGEEEEDEEMEEGEEEEEGEEAEEDGLPEELNPLLALGEVKKGTKIGAARKALDRKEEADEIQNLIDTYAPKKDRKKKKAEKDEEELLLEKLEGMMGDDESGTDEADEPPLFSDLKQEKSKPAKKKAKQPTEADEAAIFDVPGGDEEEEEDEIEVDDELMREMKEDTAALQDMYGDAGYEAGETFGAPEMDEEEGEEDSEPQGEEGEEDEEDEELDPSLTPFQQKQMRLQKSISKIEKERLGDKHWTLTGETMASSRPENALLEEHLEFDTTQQARPLVTAEMTKSLEERLTKRIQESLFDDVVRRERRSTAMDLTIEHKNEIDLHAKSKVGLADLYEKEWLDNHRRQLEEEGETSRELTEEEKEELKVIQMWRALSSSLDMLSNFYFTPKPMPEDELRVRSSQKSAIAMEEVTPAAVSAITVPEFTAGKKKRKFENVGEDELTTSEKKRLRKTKKEMHQAKQKRVEHQKAKREEGKKKFKEAKAAMAAE